MEIQRKTEGKNRKPRDIHIRKKEIETTKCQRTR
jgi:hypothetical protein